jgi:ribonuclease G
MEEAIRSFLTNEKEDCTTHVHPFVEAYLTKGVMSIQNKWFLRYKKWVTVIPRDSFKYLEYALYNSKRKS